MRPLTPPRLYAIADADALGIERLPEAVATMAREGVEWIQIRAKGVASDRMYDLLQRATSGLASRARIWIDDRADLAALLAVAGVHVGQDDLPAAAVRTVVGPERWIGRSTHDLEQARAAQADPQVDVVALGPIFPTTGKERPDPVVGLDLLRRVRRHVSKPLVAIGGIDGSNLASVLRAGADSVAMLGAVCRGDVAGNSRRLLRLAEEIR